MKGTDIESNDIKVGQILGKLDKVCLTITIIAQLIIIGLGVVILYNIDKYSPNNLLMAVMMPVVVIEVLNIFICRLIYGMPIDNVSRAISSRISEKPRVYPPNVNTISGVGAQETTKMVEFINNAYIGPTDDNGLVERLRNGKVAMDILHSLPVGIVAFDDDFNIVASNKRAPVNKTPDGDELELNFDDAKQSLESWFYSVRNQSLSASKYWTRIKGLTDNDTPLRIYDVAAVYNDSAVSGLSLIIAIIDRTADYAETQEDIDFVAMAAHELRSPITAIRGYLEMLSDDIYPTGTDYQRELLDRLNTSSSQLTMYINNVLNANRFDHRHLRLKLRRCQLSDIVSDIKHDLELRASTVGRNLSWNIPKDLPDIAADKSSIAEVITNLVDNAVKYSPKGSVITVSARREGVFVAVSVADHGIGIPSSVADHLFTRFYRSHRSSEAVGGTGIGLYISRAIVESHGGTIGVNSVEGKGSVFTITIPIYETVKNRLALDNGMNDELIEDSNKKIINHAKISD